MLNYVQLCVFLLTILKTFSVIIIVISGTVQSYLCATHILSNVLRVQLRLCYTQDTLTHCTRTYCVLLHARIFLKSIYIDLLNPCSVNMWLWQFYLLMAMHKQVCTVSLFSSSIHHHHI